MPGHSARLALHLGANEIGLALRRIQAAGPIICDRLLVTDSGRDGQGLLAAVDELLKSTGLNLKALDSIAFAAGPGGFSRVRVACAVAQGLGMATNCPVVPLNSLQALSQAVMSSRMPAQGTRMAALVDARMQEAYCATYICGPGNKPETALEPALIKVAALEDHLGEWRQAGGPILLCGDAWDRYGLSQVFSDSTMIPDPPADEIAAACLSLSDEVQGVAPANAGPIYLRDKVALNITEQAALRVRNAKESARP